MSAGRLVWLALVLILPLAGRLVGRPRSGGSPGLRRASAHLLHLAAVACCVLLALEAGRPSGAHPGWDRSSALFVLLAGCVWVEGALLAGIRPIRRNGLRPPAPAAETGRPAQGAAEASGEATAASRRAEAHPGRTQAMDEPLPAEARLLLRRILRLEQVTVEEILTPRDRIVFADSTEPLATALRRMRSTGRSRLPVAAGSPDRVLGVLHAKDLFPLVLGGERPASQRRHLRRYLSVPQGQSAARLLEDFRQHRVHIGLVSDPLGATTGLVTVTDVFRFLTGMKGREADDSPGEGAP